MRVDVAVRRVRWLQGLAIGLSVFFVGMFLYISLRRMTYPFEVEVIEASMMTSVWRLRHGYPLYGAPSLQWASYLYAPLFFWLAAALSKVMGVSYAPLRAVSILSTLGSFGMIYAMVWKETRRVAAAIVAVGLFASLYAIVYGWFDFGRVDMLSVFLFLVAMYATRRMHPVVAAIFWVLACASKQTYLPLGLAFFLMEWARPRRMLMGMATLAAMDWAGTAWLNHATNHWFSYYAFGTTGGLGLVPLKVAVLSLPLDLLQTMAIAVGLVLAAMLVAPLPWRSRDGSFYGIVTLMLGGAVWFVRIHQGANINATIPMFAWMAILMGVAVHRLLEAAEGSERTALWKERAAGLLWLAVVMQLAAHVYHASELLGVRSDAPGRQAFIDKLRATPGDVWVVAHSYDAMTAGKPMHAEMDSFDAVLGRKYAPAVAEFQQAMRERKFTAVVLDQPASDYGPKGVFTTPPFTDAYPLMVLWHGEWGTSAPDKPLYVMLPCTALTSPAMGLVDVQHGFVDRSRCH